MIRRSFSGLNHAAQRHSGKWEQQPGAGIRKRRTDGVAIVLPAQTNDDWPLIETIFDNLLP